MVEYFALSLYLNVGFMFFIQIKTKVLASYNKHFELYAEIHRPIAVNSSQMELARKNIISLSDAAVIFYKAGSRTGVEDRYMKFTLSADTYSIDDFNAKFKVAVL